MNDLKLVVFEEILLFLLTSTFLMTDTWSDFQFNILCAVFWKLTSVDRVIESITTSQISKGPIRIICLRPVLLNLTARIRVNLCLCSVAIVVFENHGGNNLAIFAWEALGEAKPEIEPQFGRVDLFWGVVKVEGRNLTEDVFGLPPPYFYIGRGSKVDHVNSEKHGKNPTQDRSVYRVKIVG